MTRPRIDVTQVENRSIFEHPLARYIQRVKQGYASQLSGGLSPKRQASWDMMGRTEVADTLVFDPGNRQSSPRSPGPLSPKVSLGKPIDYDTWYLFWAGNILRKGHADFSLEEWITRSLEKMEAYFLAVDPAGVLRALKQPVQAENVDRIQSSGGVYPVGVSILGFSGMSAGPVSRDIIADWKYTVKESFFETILETNTPFYPSLAREKSVPFERYVPQGLQPMPPKPDTAPYQVGPKDPHTDGYSGYIAFPVGAMGTMWQMAVATGSALANGSISGVRPYDAQTAIVSGGELLPPFDMIRSDVPGHKLLDKGYLVSDDTTVEYPAQPFPDMDNPKAHGWFRYWIKKNNVEIIPGELVALVCRPYPNHCWWFQESSPIVYAGNWIETEFYTSGIVKEVIEPWISDDPMPATGYYDPDLQVSKGVDGNHYRVWVKNEELILESSDFLEYEVDDTVGILKTWRDEDVNNGGYVFSSDEAKPKNFNWMDLQFFNLEGKNTDDNDLFITDWVLVPVAFYESSGNSMGGA